MKVLLLATRDPRGPLSGRKVVLATILSSLERLGHRVDVWAIGRESKADGGGAFQGRVSTLRPPGLVRVLWNTLRHFAPGRWSVNECLYYSPPILRRLQEIVEAEGYALIVADMIRTAPYAARLGRPWVLDLDDLLSKRYAGMAARGARRDAILGYYSENVPRPLVRPLTVAARWVLRRESRVLARREESWARAADAVCLVGRDEAAELSSRIGAPVFWAPMTISIPTAPADRVGARPPGLVFLGGLDYQPNLDAVRYYVREVYPHLARQGLRPLALTVIGSCPDAARRELQGAPVRLLGYVDDLGAELQKYQIFLAPIVTGGGLKTKILVAMAWGLPVVSTAFAAEGLGLQHRVHGYVAADAPEFARWVAHAWKHLEEAERVAERWREIVAHATELPAAGGPAGGPSGRSQA